MSRALAGSRTPVTITAMSIKKTKRGIKGLEFQVKNVISKEIR